MSFNGFANIDLSHLKDDRPSILGVGSHEVTINDAKVEANPNKGTHQLVVSYSNDAGQIRQWIYLNHPKSEKATEIGLIQVKRLLIAVGHDGDSTPEDVSYLKGKKVGIKVVDDEYNGEVKKKVSANYAINGADKSETKPDLDDEIPF
jgi:hypothetical protein